MKPQLLTIRAIGADFANRIYYPVLVTTVGVFVVTVSLISWLATTNQWWLLLSIPTIMAACVGIGLLAVFKLIIRTVKPAQSVVQAKARKNFVDKLQRLSEVTQTPKYILLFHIVRDIAAPRKNGYIDTLAGDTASLKGDYKQLIALFGR